MPLCPATNVSDAHWPPLSTGIYAQIKGTHHRLRIAKRNEEVKFRLAGCCRNRRRCVDGRYLPPSKGRFFPNSEDHMRSMRRLYWQLRNQMKQVIKTVLPARTLQALRSFKNNYLDSHSLKSYSQEGEDMILRRLFEKKKTGFYVDVGAHHPRRFSNTYYFYRLGWNGINIDAMPGSMTRFRRFRRRDINLEIPISNEGAVLTYYEFNEPALNSFSRELSIGRQNKNDGYFIQREARLQTFTLGEILDKYLPMNTSIDFLSVDVEGFDFEVLKSNEWDKYRPTVVLVEILGSNWLDVESNEIVRYLKQYDYILFAKALYTVLFVQEQYVESVLSVCQK